MYRNCSHLDYSRFVDEIRRIQSKPLSPIDIDNIRNRIMRAAEKDEFCRFVVMSNLRPAAQQWLKEQGFTLAAMQTVGEFTVSWE